MTAHAGKILFFLSAQAESLFVYLLHGGEKKTRLYFPLVIATENLLKNIMTARYPVLRAATVPAEC